MQHHDELVPLRAVPDGELHLPQGEVTEGPTERRSRVCSHSLSCAYSRGGGGG